MSIKIYNTLTRKKEEFVPLEPNKVKIYVCGPTVYDYLHIGNFRGPIFFNLVRNWFEKKGFEVTHVQNYTDVDDKIINRAREKNTDPTELSNQFILEYEKDFQTLKLKKPHHTPRVTHHMDDIIKMIEELINNDKAYVVNGEVFYSVHAFDGYGKLSQKNIEDLMVGIRVEIGASKRNPLDFSLWKPAKPGEPKWPSPWGEGRPGWHIECSAMSSKLLGETFDIHGGGIDLIFPHHENEIAQSEGATHKKMVNYWMHWNFINFGSEKMSKSLGNILTARHFIETYNPEILKYLILMSHYRSHSDFSPQQVQATIKALARFYSALSLAQKALEQPVVSEKDLQFEKLVQEAQKSIEASLDDDFNTPEVLARLFELVRQFNASYRIGQRVTPQVRYRAEGLTKVIKETGELMALFQEPPHKFLRTLDDMLLTQMNLKREDVDQLVAKRAEARAMKDFKTSDELRLKLQEMGIAVSDSPEGSTWEVAK